ncbi:HNH endonuclease [Ferrovibrio terrae]
MLNPDRRIYIGKRDATRKCRFCKRESPHAQFNTKAHAVPELIGNKTLLTLEECNECNQNIGRYEDDFSKFTHFERTFNRIPGKKGIPSIRIPNAKSRVEARNNNINFIEGENENLFNMNFEENVFTAKLQKQSYRPLGVYKSLLKMGLSIMPHDELENFNEACLWISQPDLQTHRVSDGAGYYCFLTFTPGPRPYPHPILTLLKRKTETPHPYMSFILRFGNRTYQIFLPAKKLDKHLEGKDITLVGYPSQFMHYDLHNLWKYGKTHFNHIKLSSTNLRTDDKGDYQFRFDSVSEEKSSEN